jgi:hypothetical protein
MGNFVESHSERACFSQARLTQESRILATGTLSGRSGPSAMKSTGAKSWNTKDIVSTGRQTGNVAGSAKVKNLNRGGKG